ncbi:hypothetical protein X777_15499 [Ooceraea biroi]|uniref:Uncharacterized protein n=1 Tax=Ooceraea biroi TaxID=2015173 RepID=A0A026VVE8_OOCBI|nr:hypothetical protein X777_15499 [Ooceraea biroi]
MCDDDDDRAAGTTEVTRGGGGSSGIGRYRDTQDAAAGGRKTTRYRIVRHPRPGLGRPEVEPMTGYDDLTARVTSRVAGTLASRSRLLLTTLTTLLVALSCCCARASEFPERECCDLPYPIPEPTGRSTSAPTPTGRSGKLFSEITRLTSRAACLKYETVTGYADPFLPVNAFAAGIRCAFKACSASRGAKLISRPLIIENDVSYARRSRPASRRSRRVHETALEFHAITKKSSPAEHSDRISPFASPYFSRIYSRRSFFTRPRVFTLTLSRSLSSAFPGIHPRSSNSPPGDASAPRRRGASCRFPGCFRRKMREDTPR